jgi:fused signal recognition particle receptor
MGRFSQSLLNTRHLLWGRLARVVGRPQVNGMAWEEMEEVLMLSDMGVEVTTKLLGELKDRVAQGMLKDPCLLIEALKEKLKGIMKEGGGFAFKPQAKPWVIMAVGINGTGKTTTIGKLSHLYRKEGYRVLLAASDTFRAAGTEQLSLWAQLSGADLVKNRPGADPASVAYDALEAAIVRGYDLLIVDTAGRLHTRVNLMEELKKIKRVLGKRLPGSPHEILLVLDATTGQNAISQARLFNEGVGVTGLVLAKLDGTAKGGIVVAIKEKLGLPVRFVGTGEKVEDLEAFDPDEFVDALFEGVSVD